MEAVILGMVVAAAVQGVGCGQQDGPRYHVNNRPCEQDSQCSGELGEVCHWLYGGCDYGQCMCNPGTHTPDSNGKCIPVKLGNEACRSGHRCPESMQCTNGTCQCAVGTMSADNQLCILPTQRLLGQACNSDVDTCYHKPSYGSLSAQAARCGALNLCECDEGYKREKNTCRRLHIGERGCSEAFHCGGGAICFDGFCHCPNGYKPIAGKTKCAKIGALSELPVGRKCDEVDEVGYCARGLVCHRCLGKNFHTCVRYQYLNYEGDRIARSRAGCLHSWSYPLLFLLMAFFCWLR